MNISIFVKNKNLDPSSYYRIGQFIDKLEVEKINLFEFQSDDEYLKLRKTADKKFMGKYVKFTQFIKCSFRRYNQIKFDLKHNRPDIIFIQREIFPRYMPIIFKKQVLKYLECSRKVIWDFDDNIIYSGEISSTEKKILSEYTDNIIVTNKYLKDTIENQYHEKIEYIATTDLEAVEYKEFNNNDNYNNKVLEYENTINLVWVGTKGNLKYLKKIISELDNVAKLLSLDNKKLVLKVISDGFIEIKDGFLKIENIKWNRKIALLEIKRSHIGLMPLEETEFTLGKAGFKAVQYISMGIPAIISDVGFNKYVVKSGYNGYLIKNSEEWEKNIYELSTNISLWKEMCKNSKGVTNKRFNPNFVIDRLNEIIRSQKKLI